MTWNNTYPDHTRTRSAHKTATKNTIRTPLPGKVLVLQRVIITLTTLIVGTFSLFIPIKGEQNVLAALLQSAGAQGNAPLPTRHPPIQKTTPQVKVTRQSSPTATTLAREAAPGDGLSHGNDAYHNIFSDGQCTDWAYDRFYKLHGYSIPWDGNASEWVANAQTYEEDGWVVSTQPRLYAIIVIAPGVQYASPYGHAGIVERINADGTIYASSYNVKGVGILSYQTYTPGNGIMFIWHT